MHILDSCSKFQVFQNSGTKKFKLIVAFSLNFLIICKWTKLVTLLDINKSSYIVQK